MRTILSYILFIIIQIIFLPLAIIGAIVIYYKQIFVSKRLGVSSTAIEIINGRWTMDKFCLRDDATTVKLFNVLPNTSALSHWLVLLPLYLLKLIAGKNLIYPVFKESEEAGLYNLVISRTIFFDRFIKKSLKQSEQFVVLGAGFDTRCYGVFNNGKVECFEVDKEQTQKLKKDFLIEANIEISNVHFVTVDFSDENWFKKLYVSGYDKNKSTTFLWEGVTLYLPENVIKNTLKEIRNNAAPGSVVFTDFYSNHFVHGNMLPGKKHLEVTNEKLRFGIEFENNGSKELTSLIESEKLKLGEVYYMGNKTKYGTWMAVAEIKV